jgi:hypothetical protein
METAALFTQVSMRPKCDTACVASDSTCALSETSVGDDECLTAPFSDLPRGFVERGLVTRGKHDGRAPSREHVRGFAPDPGRRTGNHDHLLRERSRLKT